MYLENFIQKADFRLIINKTSITKMRNTYKAKNAKWIEVQNQKIK